MDDLIVDLHLTLDEAALIVDEVEVEDEEVVGKFYILYRIKNEKNLNFYSMTM
jgi:hypothetical protein